MGQKIDIYNRRLPTFLFCVLSPYPSKTHDWCGIWLHQWIISQGFLNLCPWGWKQSYLVAEAITYKTHMLCAAIFPMKWRKIVRENKLDTQSNQKQEMERGGLKIPGHNWFWVQLHSYLATESYLTVDSTSQYILPFCLNMLKGCFCHLCLKFYNISDSS